MEQGHEAEASAQDCDAEEEDADDGHESKEDLFHSFYLLVD